MATDPDQEEFLEDDEQDEIARRSIFSAGWFRALLVLTVLAIVVAGYVVYTSDLPSVPGLSGTPAPEGAAQLDTARVACFLQNEHWQARTTASAGATRVR